LTAFEYALAGHSIFVNLGYGKINVK